MDARLTEQNAEWIAKIEAAKEAFASNRNSDNAKTLSALRVAYGKFRLANKMQTKPLRMRRGMGGGLSLDKR